MAREDDQLLGHDLDGRVGRVAEVALVLCERERAGPSRTVAVGALPRLLSVVLAHAGLDLEVADRVRCQAGVHVDLKVGSHLASEGVGQVATA